MTRFLSAIDDRQALQVDAHCLALLVRPPAFLPAAQTHRESP